MSNLSEMMINIEKYLSPSIISSAKQCAKRLMFALNDGQGNNQKRVLLAYGGGKDSSYMVAYVRYIQGLVWTEQGDTFRLRISTNRHAGMNDSVMENIDRVYRALNIHGDELVECLVTDGLLIRPFERHLSMPDAVRWQNRMDVLMNGHRFQADARSTFCNACNLSMVNSFGLAAHYDGGADIIITGDSPQEQTAYVAWARHLSRLFDAPKGQYSHGFSAFLETLDGVAKAYFGNIYGAENVTSAHRITYKLARDPLFFNIYQDTAYEAGAHWGLLKDFMKFSFDPMMFSFSESDCGNPTLMAHIRGLRAETLLKRSYAEGIREYVRFALGLMQQKDFPPHLIAEMALRYQDDDAIVSQRQRAEQFALDAFNLTTQQLICMIYSPFTERGKNLASYLAQENLRFSANAIHALLEGSDELSNIPLSQDLQQLSGLTLPQLRQCYRSQLVSSLLEGKSTDPLARILRFDPHKAVIQVSNGVTKRVASEVISGR
ncbi:MULTISPECIES: hypothetical protein [Yersinia]|uniref:hypothetical protein n=1 Tax=Yersinia TaxID=629 RepID=UPI0009B6FB6D|nr:MULTISPECIES: hypothetical protein [Yersinia]ARB82706.1 hypothetical protein A6J67_00375 [Yersinia sp. FDAARGOS_228]AVL36437.1 hypothetical protein CEQ36_13045 [Yersinia intermedia]